jgi:hypothetical protein
VCNYLVRLGISVCRRLVEIEEGSRGIVNVTGSISSGGDIGDVFASVELDGQVDDGRGAI